MKKLINNPAIVVEEALSGMAHAYPHLLRVNFCPNYIVRADAPRRGKVAVIAGGGSGHEPMHGGFVGLGMLDAACPGPIFTSPSPDQILAAAAAVDGGAGLLFIVKNYTGDVLNFAIAAEECQLAGVPVQTVLIHDDVAVEDSLYTAGRRGVGVTVLAEKICGAAAEAGASLEEVAAIGRKVSEQGRSMGVALTSCIVPAVGRPTFVLPDDEMEIGIGIHGEPGRRRAPLQSADAITDILATTIFDDLPFTRGSRVIALVNGMGGTPLMELYIIFRRLAELCEERDITISRNLIGNYITALEMAGCSLTLLAVDDELLHWWDAPVHTPALRW
ncbi:MAG TPA: dihydroxyacetone kinase subunit DhaK [Chloroflexi bacterium]|nr:dihydroxyacetone kinase subunit DhaK [Chloroflexota bacterium]HHW85857.1 dihydroxyacetone kinase subunit DhaK [Chloroflexota bacterium]